MASPDTFDGIGQWVYVAPIPLADSDQLSTTGYVYGPMYWPRNVHGIVGLSSDDEGPIAGIEMYGVLPNDGLATIRYDWPPGRFCRLSPRRGHLGRLGLRHSASAWSSSVRCSPEPPS